MSQRALLLESVYIGSLAFNDILKYEGHWYVKQDYPPRQCPCTAVNELDLSKSLLRHGALKFATCNERHEVREKAGGTTCKFLCKIAILVSFIF
jgi:hypothetical protein